MESLSRPKSKAQSSPRVGFALRFAVIAGALFTVYAFPFELFGARQDWLHGYLAAYARLAGRVLSLFEPHVTVEDTFIHGRYSLQIVRNCDAADVNILFTSATLALPADFRRKLPLAVAGIVALVSANVARICSLYYVGVVAPDRFKLFHEEVWPMLLVACAVGTFLFCTRKLLPAEAAPAMTKVSAAK